MKRLLQFSVLLGLLVWCKPAHATWSVVNHTAGCTFSASPCNLTVPATGAGNLGLCLATFNLVGATMTSCTGAGTSVHPAGCASSDASARSSDLAYVTSLTGGVTTITYNGPGNFNTVEFFELKGSGPAFDVCNQRNQSSSLANMPGVSAGTLSGSNDAIVQWATVSSGYTGCPNSGTSLDSFPQGDAYCYLINSTNNAAGSYANLAGTAGLSAVAFKESASAGIPWYKLPTVGPSWAISILIGFVIGAGYCMGGMKNELSADNRVCSIGRLAGHHPGPAQPALGSAVIEMWPDAAGTYQAVPLGALTRHSD